MSHSTPFALRHSSAMTGLPGRPVSALTGYWLAFVVSASAFVIDHLLGSRAPELGVLLQVASLVTCGLAWLLARALFRPNAKPEYWPGVIVALLFLTCLVSYVDRSNATGGVIGYVGNLQGFIGSAVLLLTFVEAIDMRDHARPERRFRWTFAAVYLAVIATSFAVELPEFSAWQASTQAVLATLAVIGATLAYRYRRRHPLLGRRRTMNASVARPELAAAITGLLVDEHCYLDPEIKVRRLAARLEEPEYKVSQCIVDDLGYRNFNQMINAYRVDAAKALLRDPAESRAILAIALDCGFASLGPFNRAFKTQTGMTPTAFRRAQHATAEDVACT